MKKINFIKSACLICFLCFSLLVKAQPPYWKLGGNPNTGPSTVNTTNNQLGTDASNNTPLSIVTNGVQRMLIENGGVGFAEGRIAMFNTLPVGFAAQDRLHLHQNVRGPLIRFTNNGTGSFNTDGFRVGINDVAIATLQNFENTAMEFYNTNIERMHINADNGTTDGFIGMGNGFNNPQSHLHINNPTNQETWMQITNVDVGETPTDGLRLGILDETPITRMVIIQLNLLEQRIAQLEILLAEK